MPNKVKEKLYSRKLDDQAKVFALASNKKYSSIFRLSVTLKEKVEKEILLEAVRISFRKI